MRVIALRTLRAYWEKEPKAEQSLKSWFAVIKKAQWGNHNELKEQFGKASIINSLHYSNFIINSQINFIYHESFQI